MKWPRAGVGFSIAVAWAASCLAQEFTVQPLADGVYCFQSGFYTNLFVVTSEGVVATDPINSRVARRYEQAIRQITRSPVRYVIYSHDHSDHIAGGAVFRKTAKFIAHENAAPRIRARRNPEIVPPDITFQTDYTLSLGGRQLRLLYFGQNHSDSNIAIFLPAERILMFVDMVYPGSVPFRDLPGTDIRGLLEALPRVRELEFDTLIYGHGPPGGKEWVGKYIAYFGDLAAELEKARANGGGVQLRGAPRDARKALDYYVDSIVSRAVEALRPRYGRWGGFDDWAAMNARAMFFYLMMDT